jgi:hypothetical protein
MGRSVISAETVRGLLRVTTCPQRLTVIVYVHRLCAATSAFRVECVVMIQDVKHRLDVASTDAPEALTRDSFELLGTDGEALRPRVHLEDFRFFVRSSAVPSQLGPARPVMGPGGKSGKPRHPCDSSTNDSHGISSRHWSYSDGLGSWHFSSSDSAPTMC